MKNRLLLLILFFAAANARPQASSVSVPRFDRLPSELGLSQNLISAIMQDRKGFLWVGTKDGLNRFDGYKFTIYRHDSYDSTSLSDSYITALLEDRAGRIWVGTLDGGLNLFDRATETFYHVAPNRLNHPNVTAIAEDESRDSGTIWVATLGGIVRLTLPLKNARGAGAQTLAGATFTSFAHDPNDTTSLGSDLVYKIVVDQNGVVWAATELGIYRIMPAGDRHPDSHLDTLKENRGVVRRLGSEVPDARWRAMLDKSNRLYLFNLCKGQNGRIWIGNALGLLCWNATANEFLAYDPITDVPWGPRVMFEEDRQGILWYAGNLSLWRFDWRARKRQQFKHDPNDPESIAESSIISFCEDSAGVLWFGSNGNGLYKYDPRAAPFSRRQNQNRNGIESGKLSLWRGTSIRSLGETSDGTVWLGAARGGLLRLNRVTGAVERVMLMLPNRERAAFFFSILQDRKGTLWLGSEYGLLKMEWREGKLRRLAGYEPEPHDPLGSRADCVYKIFEDHAGEIWFATNTQFFHLNQSTGSLTSYRFSTEDPRAVLEYAYPFIHQDRHGRFWLGTKDGLHRFDPQNGSFTRYRNQPQDLSSLSHNVVRAICEDPFEPEKILWLGTAGGGLNRFDMTTERFTHFTIKDGLPDMVIYAILSDREGNLWMSTNHGLSRFNPRTHAFKNFDVNDGLQDNEFNSCAYFKSASGELFFGGIGGFNAFYPEDIQDNRHVPPVVITDFQIFNKSVQSPKSGVRDPKSILKKPIAETEEITLSYEHNVFSFEFAALDYTDPAKNRYAYKMENFDRDWQQAGTKRTATYTNLNPGEYVFRVKAANNDGVWNEAGAAIKIKITPPWWRTWWAYAAYVVFGLGAIAATIKGRVRYLERRTRELEATVAQRTTEVTAQNQQLAAQKEKLLEQANKLEEMDRLKSNFFANISHEFRTPLALILGPAEQEMTEAAEGRLKRNLALIKGNAQRLLRLINQLLDLSRLESKKMELKASRGNLVEFLKGLTMSFASLAERKHITLQFFASVETLAAYFDRDKLEKIFYNLLSNAFKFTPEGGGVEVSIEQRAEGRGQSAEGLEQRAEGLAKKALSPTLSALRPLPSALVFVRDTGIGIPAERLPHIFDRFYQVDSSSTREYEGSGIGLALVKELVELHHGTVSVTSTVGKGSTFTVQLPLGKAHLQPHEIVATAVKATRVEADIDFDIDRYSATSGKQPATSDEQQATSDETIILVVEDHADFRNFIRGHLEPDYKILEAANGADGFEKALAAIPDLVISDVMMPKMNGYELCAKLKTDERTSHVPVILLTAKAGTEDKIAGLQTGADDYLSKPFEPRELQARVKNLIELRQKLKARFSGTTWIKPSEVSAQPLDQKFLERLAAIVEANMQEEDFGIEQLCREAVMGERQLQRKLKALVNQSPTTFIRALRLRRALQLLEQNAGTVSEIAFQVGFNNLSYFTRAFREMFGKLPSEVGRA